jgi:hypothetical protein
METANSNLRKAFDVGYSDLPGGRVMAEQKQSDKAEEEKKPEFKKTTEYRRFRKLLKQVVKAPPLRRKQTHGETK